MSVLFEKPEDLSEYLFRIVDNGGESCDRYTVAFSDGTYLALSGAPTHPQGFSQAGEGLDPAVLAEWVEKGDSVDLALGDLPEHIVKHIIARCNEGFADFLASVEAGKPEAVAASRAAAKENDGTVGSLGKGIYRDAEGWRVRLDGAPEDDRGPYATAREAVLASLPDQHSFSGPEYHSTLDVMRLVPDAEVARKLADLVAKREAAEEWERSSRP